METQWLPESVLVWITTLAAPLDARQLTRFVKLCGGLLFARGRRTVTSWLRLRRRAGLQTLLLPPGQRRTQDHGDRRRIAPDPSESAPRPVRRHASGLRPRRLPHQAVRPHIEGAGKHHNPTPGPAGSKFLYGHVWVCLARVVRHPKWGAIAFPILSHLYIRAKDIGWMAAYYGWQFRTKLELAVAQVRWLVEQLGKAAHRSGS